MLQIVLHSRPQTSVAKMNVKRVLIALLTVIHMNNHICTKMRHLKYLLCLIITSCGSINPNAISSISFDTHTDILVFSDVFNVVEAIPLEAKRECLISRADKARVFDSKYFILDRHQGHSVFVFNGDGTYSHHVGNWGHGHGEVTFINDFTIDKANRRIILLTHPSTIFVYDLNGKFLMSKKLTDATLWNIEYYKDGYLCSTNHRNWENSAEKSLYYFFDKDFNLQHTMGDQLPETVSIPPMISNPIQVINNKLCYIDNFKSACVFFDSIDTKNNSTQITLELGNDMDDYDIFYHSDMLKNLIKLNLLDEAYWEGKFIIGSLIKEKALYAFELDLDSKKGEMWPISFVYPRLYDRNEDIYYTLISAPDFISSDYFKNHPLAQTLTERDNFVLLRLKRTKK